jgi:predicted DsbA family dithiol-disulfide isomerase
MTPVEPRSIVVYGDLACPWATCAVARLHHAREQLGLVDDVAFDLRAFPLELVNERPTPKTVLDAEIPVAGALEPDFGFRVWSEPDWTWPGSVLVALEAVQAAKEQSLSASAGLDLALRRAFFRDHRPVSLLPVVLDVAAETDDVDAEALAKTLHAGGHRAVVVDQWRAAEDFGVEASPHLFLADGTDYVNPGVEMHWVEEPGTGFPIVDEDDPSVYEEILDRAARA